MEVQSVELDNEDVNRGHTLICKLIDKLILNSVT